MLIRSARQTLGTGWNEFTGAGVVDGARPRPSRGLRPDRAAEARERASARRHPAWRSASGARGPHPHRPRAGRARDATPILVSRDGGRTFDVALRRSRQPLRHVVRSSRAARPNADRRRRVRSQRQLRDQAAGPVPALRAPSPAESSPSPPSARKRYPAPRTVSMLSTPNGRSIFPAGSGRRRPRRSSGSRTRRPPCSISCRRSRPCPGRRMKVSSRANSCAGSSISVSPGTRGGPSGRAGAPPACTRPAALPAPTGEGPQPGQQLGETERLEHVVVRPPVEAGHPVRHRIARREHQHRRTHPVGADAPARLEAVDPRQHHVQHDHVVVRRTGQPRASSPLTPRPRPCPPPVRPRLIRRPS